VHVTAIDDDLVFLNLPADTYLSVAGAGRTVTVDPASGQVVVGDAELAAELAAAKLVTRGASEARLPTRAWPGRPTRTAFPEAAETPRWRDGPEALTCLLDLARRYRGRALGDLVALTRQDPRTQVEPRITGGLVAAVAAFHRWVPYAPVSGKCLLRSFMLLRLLRRQGHDALWVFGVSTWPFQAHCWLQCEDLVLDDTFERLWPYHPILVI
jgi:hypothetical protein